MYTMMFKQKSANGSYHSLGMMTALTNVNIHHIDNIYLLEKFNLMDNILSKYFNIVQFQNFVNV